MTHTLNGREVQATGAEGKALVRSRQTWPGGQPEPDGNDGAVRRRKNGTVDIVFGKTEKK